MKVSTPVAAGELAIATGGYPAAGRPILAIRAADGSIAWRHDRGSPYTSTPLVYDGLLYIVTDNGILSAYQVADGVRVYQQRLPPVAGTFSASPVAADGRIYLASEDGQVFVVRAGRTFALLATNDMKEAVHGHAGHQPAICCSSARKAACTHFAPVTDPRRAVASRSHFCVAGDSPRQIVETFGDRDCPRDRGCPHA